MGKGRKVIPINIKKAKGTNRKTREKDVPPPSDDKPIPPAWLNAKAKKIFYHMIERLSVIKLDSDTYTEAIALLSSRMEEVERYDKLLNSGKKEYAVIYKSYNTTGGWSWKKHPYVELRDTAMKHVGQLLVEFGLTGASAQKIGTKKEKPKPNAFQDFA
jgi:P27 family predicted phage terminase small subunit